jgi:hypothetical protein
MQLHFASESGMFGSNTRLLTGDHAMKKLILAAALAAATPAAAEDRPPIAALFERASEIAYYRHVARIAWRCGLRDDAWLRRYNLFAELQQSFDRRDLARRIGAAEREVGWVLMTAEHVANGLADDAVRGQRDQSCSTAAPTADLIDTLIGAR